MGNQHSKQEKNKIKRKHSLPTPYDHANKKKPSLDKQETPTDDFYVVNGRKYQKVSKKYILPHDDLEQDRLTEMHFLYKHLFNSNFSAPVKDLLSIKKRSQKQQQSSRRSSTNSSQYNEWFLLQEPTSPRVLDLACGNGTWVLEMATDFPDSQFYGIDIVANYPTSIKPSNATFLQLDILDPKGLPYPDEYFDYIHMRQVYSCFSESDWEVVVKEIKRLLKPGGYVEVRDVDPLLQNVNDTTPRFFGEYPSMMKEKLGVNIFWSRYMFEILKEVGEMSEMHQTIKQLGFNTSGPVGQLAETSFRAALESHKFFFVTYYNIPESKYEEIINTVIRNAIKDNSYINYYCCWGRKSLLADTNLHHPIDTIIVSPDQHKYSLVKEKNQLKNVCCLARSHSFHIASYELAKESQRRKSCKTSMDYYSQQTVELVVHPLEEQVGSLAAESVSDIDQFSAGYED